MGCDGIWEKYVDNNNGMCALVKELLVKHQGKYKSVVEDLLEVLIAKDTREGVGCDNMTAILISFR
jgi:serine/threonine protein phosphatase PrpC